MRIFNFTVTCSVCGKEGAGTIQTAAASWDSRCEVRHIDPKVCAENLRRSAAVSGGSTP